MVVVSELFTYARCSYCPFASAALESLKKEFKDSLIVVAYHRRLLGDTLSPANVEERRSFYYEGGGEPAVFFNGYGPIRTESPERNYSVYKENILLAQNKNTRIKISLSFESEQSFKIVISPLDTFLNRDLRLISILTEDSVYFKLAGVPESIYNNVVRSFIPDEQGLVLNLTPGDSVVKFLTFTLKPYFKKEHLSLVTFVQDFNNKEILAGVEKKIYESNSNSQYNFDFYCLSDTIQTVRLDSSAVFRFFLKNTGTVFDVYEIKAVVTERVPNWGYILCVKGMCIEPDFPVFDSLFPQQTDTMISFTIYPMSNTGRTIAYVKVRSLGDPTKQDSQLVYTATTSIEKIRDSTVSKELEREE